MKIDTGLEHPKEVKESVKEIVSFCDSQVPLLRERAVNALGRIGRADYHLIEEYWEDLFRFASDEDPKVRLSFIWASENIATNTPDFQYLRQSWHGLCNWQGKTFTWED